MSSQKNPFLLRKVWQKTFGNFVAPDKLNFSVVFARRRDFCCINLHL
jgi:hypothetical protein